MTKEQKYQVFKSYLNTLNLSAAEYERRIREWCRIHRY